VLKAIQNDFEKDNSTLNCSSQVWSEQRKCVDGASRIKVNEHMAYATKITDVVETCTRDRKDVIGKGMMRIKHETEVTSKGNRMNQ